jgi:hypothetical protein
MDSDHNGLDGTAPAWRPVATGQSTTTATPTIAADMPSGSPWSGNPGGLSLQLSQSIVKSGEIITRSISGQDLHPDVMTSSALILEDKVNGSWRDLYYMDLDS